MDKPDLADVLAEVNRLRTEHGIGEPLTEMPKGERMSACGCPVARALTRDRDLPPAICRTSYGWLESDNYPTPSTVAAFIRSFDGGAYTELIA